VNGTCRVNGTDRSLPSPGTVIALLEELELGLGTVVIELNGVALTRPEAAMATLADGDRVEIVRAVAGG
jgi:sulfur carrier protein